MYVWRCTPYVCTSQCMYVWRCTPYIWTSVCMFGDVLPMYGPYSVCMFGGVLNMYGPVSSVGMDFGFFYRSHGWRHFVMVCIVGAAILILFAPLGCSAHSGCRLVVYCTVYRSHGGRHFDLVNAPLGCTLLYIEISVNPSAPKIYCLFLIGYKYHVTIRVQPLYYGSNGANKKAAPTIQTITKWRHPCER